MRELRENVRYQPARDRYKIFIIDEAHQITNEAFNALLKTIEEPPPWAVFILCTTEAHKIPATIASRCQHFSFRSVDFDDLVARMAWICEQEGIRGRSRKRWPCWRRPAKAACAIRFPRSIRLSPAAARKLNAAEVRALLGAFSLESLERVSQALADGDSRRMLEVVDELERNGQNLQHFARELARYFRNLLVARIAGADTRLIAASPAQRQRMAEIAAQFSEEDLTRYLSLTLEIFTRPASLIAAAFSSRNRAGTPGASRSAATHRRGVSLAWRRTAEAADACARRRSCAAGAVLRCFTCANGSVRSIAV